jgi:Ser/Thr protein kinase RdoA (MazF antagonist)
MGRTLSEEQLRLPLGPGERSFTENPAQLDLNLFSPLARGRTADIYAWEDGFVLKLFQSRFGAEETQLEAEIGHAVSGTGLPVPGVGDVVQVNGRNGVIYERVDGTTMLAALGRKPWRILYYARRLAALHAQMHAFPFNQNIPPQRGRLDRKIRHASALPVQLKSAVLAALEAMPDGDRLCHGDFHPDNILLASKAEVIIDWLDATRGNPLADVARTSIIALGAVATPQFSNPFMKMLIRLFHTVYIGQYFRIRPGGELEYRRWLPIAAAARLSENIPELEEWLIGEAQKFA